MHYKKHEQRRRLRRRPLCLTLDWRRLDAEARRIYREPYEPLCYAKLAKLAAIWARPTSYPASR